ncbi:single-stranded nucleic acid binding protein [Moniliophthora roreri MCA 2997]|uniref:Probable RNA-binding protein 18 n=1 Tax=Moniliophthora roreri (strain MCA 2997) TaxID=1381753 RepID=V2X8A4_MONRO|nr:single-stranded nucleic acid binding protein [Moniliophthora roreri MCA 2997]
MNDPESLISYPTHADSPPPEAASSSQPRQTLQDRIYVGNLHPSVDEYTLLQLFAKYGKITKLDFLFHKTGPLKGKPRGYCFVEYASNDEALRALSAHDKLLRGRKLVVTHAHQAPLDYMGGQYRPRKNMMESGRPTTLSLLKTGMTGKNHDATSSKIAMMEAKLRQMEASKEHPPSSSTSTLPSHPSLPPKPAGDDLPPTTPRPLHKPPLAARAPHPPTVASLASTSVPSSSIKISSGLRLASPSGSSTSDGISKSTIMKSKSAGLLGVKIVRSRKEDKPSEGTELGSSSIS